MRRTSFRYIIYFLILFASLPLFASPSKEIKFTNNKPWLSRIIDPKNIKQNLLDEHMGAYRSSCTGHGATAVCVVAEADGTLRVSKDAGKHWTIKNVLGAPKDPHYLSVTCTSNSFSSACVAAGQSEKGALLSVSRDGGYTWSVKSINGIPNDFPSHVLMTVSCTEGGLEAVCVAAGLDKLVGVSNDGANTWAFRSLPKVPNGTDEVDFFTSSCSGKNNTALCALAGGSGTKTGPYSSPIYISSDAGKTWAAKTNFEFPTSQYSGYQALTCNGSGSNALCIAGGWYSDQQGKQDPILVVSSDGGNTWIEKTIPNLEPDSGSIYSVSCTGSSPTTICAASGWDDRLGHGPLAISIDGGNTWTKKAVSNSPSNESESLSSINCMGNGNTARCMAAGFLNDGPLLVSTDGGNTWVAKSIPGLPDNSYFFSPSCTKDDSNAICASVGVFGPNDGTNWKTLIAVSSNGGQTWELKDL